MAKSHPAYKMKSVHPSIEGSVVFFVTTHLGFSEISDSALCFVLFRATSKFYWNPEKKGKRAHVLSLIFRVLSEMLVYIVSSNVFEPKK